MQFQTAAIITVLNFVMFTCFCSTTGHKVGFEVFVRAVFYIGKGKRSRPYEHFKEAVTYFRHPIKSKV